MLDQGRKLALLVDFDQQALFPEPSVPPPEIGKSILPDWLKAILPDWVKEIFLDRTRPSWTHFDHLILGKPILSVANRLEPLFARTHPVQTRMLLFADYPPRSSASPFLIMSLTLIWSASAGPEKCYGATCAVAHILRMEAPEADLTPDLSACACGACPSFDGSWG